MGSVAYVICPHYFRDHALFNKPGGLLVGPPGLVHYSKALCGEVGCYGVALVGENVARAKVYETNQSYECFSLMGPWKYAGEITSIRGFQHLLEKKIAHGRDASISLWEFFSRGHHRVMFAMQASPTAFYLRVRASRMPDGVYAIYRLDGIETVEAWWMARGYRFLGIMSYEEAYDALSRDV